MPGSPFRDRPMSRAVPAGGTVGAITRLARVGAPPPDQSPDDAARPSGLIDRGGRAPARTVRAGAGAGASLGELVRGLADERDLARLFALAGIWHTVNPGGPDEGVDDGRVELDAGELAEL